MKQHRGGRDVKGEDMKTKPVWLELWAGGETGVEVIEVGRGLGCWDFIWVTTGSFWSIS